MYFLGLMLTAYQKIALIVKEHEYCLKEKQLDHKHTP